MKAKYEINKKYYRILFHDEGFQKII